MSHPCAISEKELKKLQSSETDPKRLYTLKVAIARRRAEAAIQAQLDAQKSDGNVTNA